MVDADSGNIGGSKSNEFHVIADTGEDDLLIDENGIGINFEIAKEKYQSNDIKKITEKYNLVHKKGIEVDRKVGGVPESNMKEFLEKNI